MTRAEQARKHIEGVEDVQWVRIEKALGTVPIMPLYTVYHENDLSTVDSDAAVYLAVRTGPYGFFQVTFPRQKNKYSSRTRKNPKKVPRLIFFVFAFRIYIWCTRRLSAMSYWLTCYRATRQTLLFARLQKRLVNLLGGRGLW